MLSKLNKDNCFSQIKGKENMLTQVRHQGDIKEADQIHKQDNKIRSLNCL